MKDRTLVSFVVLVLVLAVGYFVVFNDQREKEAHQAIEVARQSCGSNRLEFERRVMDAKAAIARVDISKQSDLSVSLENNLRLVGCEPQ